MSEHKWDNNFVAGSTDPRMWRERNLLWTTDPYVIQTTDAGWEVWFHKPWVEDAQLIAGPLPTLEGAKTVYMMLLSTGIGRS